MTIMMVFTSCNFFSKICSLKFYFFHQSKSSFKR